MRRTAITTAALALAVGLSACGGDSKREDARIQDLSRKVDQLSAKVKAQDQRIAGLGTGDKAVPLAVSTQSGPDNTVVAQCPLGAYLFRLPRTPGQGGEALCRPLTAPAPAPSGS